MISNTPRRHGKLTGLIESPYSLDWLLGMLFVLFPFLVIVLLGDFFS